MITSLFADWMRDEIQIKRVSGGEVTRERAEGAGGLDACAVAVTAVRAARRHPAGSVTFAVTCAAGPEPLLSTVNPTMRVTPGVSVPSGLIPAVI